jgi:hypothetical protein
MVLNGWEDGGIGALIIALLWAFVHWLESRKGGNVTK